MAQRLSQDQELVIAEGSPKARISQETDLVVAEGSPVARVSQLACLVLIDVATSPPAGFTPIIFCNT